jgi:hypothetical protein
MTYILEESVRFFFHPIGGLEEDLSLSQKKM